MPSGPAESVTLFGVEDIRKNKGSDLDFNDLQFGVHTLPVPAPGAVVLAGAALLFTISRRRDGI